MFIVVTRSGALLPVERWPLLTQTSSHGESWPIFLALVVAACWILRPFLG